MSRSVLCFEEKSITPQWPITLHQNGRDNFTVTYGKQVERRLTYAKAAEKLGQALMHAMSCAGDVDNRLRTDR